MLIVTLCYSLRPEPYTLALDTKPEALSQRANLPRATKVASLVTALQLDKAIDSLLQSGPAAGFRDFFYLEQGEHCAWEQQD